MKNLTILGSTGSIGTQTLDIVRQHADKFKVISLSANKNIELLEKQIKEFKPEFVVVADKEKADLLQEKVNISVLSGEKNLSKAAALNRVDILINSLIGRAGLAPTIEAIKNSKQIGLANKETLVLAGKIVMDLAKEHNSTIIPIDSEHSALFQSIKSGALSEIKRLILTMGKGPIAKMSKEQLPAITMKDILNRPAWSMGMKISVDSATCMNKTFEIIEARWLFDLPAKKIGLAVHPQYLCHSLVEFQDGSIITELGTPDMKRYVQYALFYPKREKATITSFIDLFEKEISFEKPPYNKFPCLKMGYYTLKKGGTMPAVLHGADAVAVEAFINGKIKFTDIPIFIKKTMLNHKIIKKPAITEIFEAESWAEKNTKKLIGTFR